jgi:heme exporter protein C
MNTKIMQGLLGITAVLMLAALYLIFIYVPTEANMGIVQRIFYFHVPLAWLSFLAFFVVFLGGILYLIKRDAGWDRLASSSAEVGVVFTTLFLMAGSIWAKAVWGVWWDWEPRLTSALVLWIVYIAYLLVRSYASGREQAARFGAVIGIVGFLDVPIVALAITLWRTGHPGPVIFEGGLAPSMLFTLVICILAFSALFFLLLLLKLSIKTLDFEVKQIENNLAENLSKSSSSDT